MATLTQLKGQQAYRTLLAGLQRLPLKVVVDLVVKARALREGRSCM
jgi:hypothetical protein